MIIVNFKCYTESIGENARSIAKICESVALATKKKIIIAPSFTDLHIAQDVSIPVFSQHLDPFDNGAHTGHITVSSLSSAGIKGAIINHSEHPVSLDHIKKAVDLAHKHNITAVVCASSLDMVKDIVKICTPQYIAYEPTELIGGNISVTTSKPEIIKQAAKIVRDSKLLCGAGIKTADDVKAARMLGAHGILVSSGIVKAKEPEKKLKEFALA